MLVSIYSNMEAIMKARVVKIRDTQAELKIRHEANDLAKARLKEQGIIDPRLKGEIPTYEEQRDYDSRLGAMIPFCIQELTMSNEKHPGVVVKQTWAEVAYS